MRGAKESIKRAGQHAGIHIARHSARTDPHLRRALLLDWLGVDLLFDIGANVGQYGLELRAGGYRGRIVSFEPQGGPFQELAAAAAGDDRWVVNNIGLADHAGEAEIGVSPQSGASSLLPMGARHIEMHPDTVFVGSETVRLGVADAVATEWLEDDSTVALKLDVQGFEMAVLAGAGELLRRAVFAECELLLEHLYEGQAEADELIASFYAAGLKLAGTEAGHVDAATGRVAWMDAIFIREPPAGRAPSPTDE